MSRPIRDGQHDFDFEFGTWATKLRRLKAPLTGSTEWIEYTGTTIVRPIWSGRANLVELDVTGPAGRIEGGFVISDITATTCRFEQAFSENWGTSWEPNWIAVDTRVDAVDDSSA